MESGRSGGATVIKFEVYRDGAQLMDFKPISAMVMGPESVPMAGEVVFRDG